MEPVTVEACTVLALLLDAAADADKGTDLLRVDCASVIDGHNDSARGISIAPHSVAVDSDKRVMELVRTVVHQRNIADDDPSRTIDVDAPKALDGEGGKPITIECRVHPVFLRDKENTVAGLDDAGRHSGRINVLDDAGCLLWGLGRCKPADKKKCKNAHGVAQNNQTTSDRHGLHGRHHGDFSRAHPVVTDVSSYHKLAAFIRIVARHLETSSNSIECKIKLGYQE